MRIPRIYHSGQLTTGTEVELTQEASHHLVRVLRLSLHAQVVIFNGEGGEYKTRISKLNKKNVSVFIEDFHSIQKESPLKIHLAQSIVKSDKMDLVIQKATELGVESLTPLYTQHGEHKYSPDRLDKRLQHWRNIAISASEQCGRDTLMTIHGPQEIIEFVGQQNQKMTCFILHPNVSTKFSNSLIIERPIILLIGPEGGLSEYEVEHAAKQGFKMVNFGPRIMRAETAAIASLAVIQYLWGDIG
ncbi:MAG: 16S rRNA (uracil(1498)-N(3))-methyltransferase [Gammaproteobacteria bacterium]